LASRRKTSADTGTRGEPRKLAVPSRVRDTKATKATKASKATKAAKASKTARATGTTRPAKPAKAAKAASASKTSAQSRKSGGDKADPDARARKVALAIAEAALDSKALNVEIIDVRGKVDYSDFIVVMSGRSDRQVNALGRNIEEAVEAKHGARCLGIEGMPQGTWLLMDYGDVVVHIFHEDTRGYYDLETLWIDAARIPVAES
jgi:ribosome-associated protein